MSGLSVPLGMTCVKCGNLLGIIIAPEVDRLIPLKLEFACGRCISDACKKIGVLPSSEENWGKIIAELKGRPKLQ